MCVRARARSQVHVLQVNTGTATAFDTVFRCHVFRVSVTKEYLFQSVSTTNLVLAGPKIVAGESQENLEAIFPNKTYFGCIISFICSSLGHSHGQAVNIFLTAASILTSLTALIVVLANFAGTVKSKLENLVKEGAPEGLVVKASKVQGPRYMCQVSEVFENPNRVDGSRLQTVFPFCQ